MRRHFPSEAKHSELLTRFLGVNDNIKDVKESQWKVAYYTILFFAAVVGAYQLDVVVPWFWFCILKGVTVFVVILVAFFAVRHLYIEQQHLTLNRISAQHVDDYLNRLTGVAGYLGRMRTTDYEKWLLGQRHFKKLKGKLIDKERRHRVFDTFYGYLFPSIIVGAAIATIVIVGLDNVFDKTK